MIIKPLGFGYLCLLYSKKRMNSLFEHSTNCEKNFLEFYFLSFFMFYLIKGILSILSNLKIVQVDVLEKLLKAKIITALPIF